MIGNIIIKISTRILVSLNAPLTSAIASLTMPINMMTGEITVRNMIIIRHPPFSFSRDFLRSLSVCHKANANIAIKFFITDSANNMHTCSKFKCNIISPPYARCTIRRVLCANMVQKNSPCKTRAIPQTNYKRFRKMTYSVKSHTLPSR